MQEDRLRKIVALQEYFLDLEAQIEFETNYYVRSFLLEEIASVVRRIDSLVLKEEQE